MFMKINRISKNKQYMEHAEVAAKRSHDAETQVGCILVKNKCGSIVATGNNGFVRGANDEILPNTRPDKYKIIVHAESNLIANCARNGISMEDSFLVCTMSPCVNCMRLLYQCGITHVICKELYKDFNDLQEMLDLKILVNITEEGYYHLEYKINA